MMQMAIQTKQMTKDFLDALLTVPALYGYPLISRNSKYVAYSWKSIHPNVDVFVVPTD